MKFYMAAEKPPVRAEHSPTRGFLMMYAGEGADGCAVELSVRQTADLAARLMDLIVEVGSRTSVELAMWVDNG